MTVPAEEVAGRTGRPAERSHADDGVATVWAAIAVAALVAVLSAMLGLVAAIGGRHRAEAAADLAALAAAGQAVRGEAVACGRAAGVATGTGARLVRCRVGGGEAVVEVEVALHLALLGGVTARARARAGPVEQPSMPAPVPLGAVRSVPVSGLGRHRARVRGRLDPICPLRSRRAVDDSGRAGDRGGPTAFGRGRSPR